MDRYLAIHGVGSSYATIYSLAKSPYGMFEERQLVAQVLSLPFIFGGAPIDVLRLFTSDGRETDWAYLPLKSLT